MTVNDTPRRARDWLYAELDKEVPRARPGDLTAALAEERAQAAAAAGLPLNVGDVTAALLRAEHNIGRKVISGIEHETLARYLIRELATLRAALAAPAKKKS